MFCRDTGAADLKRAGNTVYTQMHAHTRAHTCTHAHAHAHTSRAYTTLVVLHSELRLHRADCTFTAITIHRHR